MRSAQAQVTLTAANKVALPPNPDRRTLWVSNTSSATTEVLVGFGVDAPTLGFSVGFGGTVPTLFRVDDIGDKIHQAINMSTASGGGSACLIEGFV